MERELYVQQSDAFTFSIEAEHALLVALSDGVFVYYEYDFEFTFQPTENASKQEFDLRYGEEVFYFTRIQDKALEPTESKEK